MLADSYFYHYLFIGIFLVCALLIPVVTLIAARFIAPRKPSRIKGGSYECGLRSQGDPWIQFRIQYYIFALIFVIFDVEMVFLLPWAVAFKQLGLIGFIEMILFIVILATGLAYAWRKKALEWD